MLLGQVMADKRSERKATVIQFLSKLDRNREMNLLALVDLAKQLDMEGFDQKAWDEEVWVVTAGRLVKQGAKNTRKVTLNFSYPPKLGGAKLLNEWADIAKALVLLRFHRHHQAIENQRNFVSAVSYVAFEMAAHNFKLFQLTPEFLDRACRKISADYGEGTAYNMHKAVAEFAAHCDANSLCNVLFRYKYARMRRPEATGGVNHKRLDDPETKLTSGDKLIDPNVFKIIGELHRNVPLDHKYRFYVLVLTLVAMTGRRFSEISLLPYQDTIKDEKGRAYLLYFPRKASVGDSHTPSRKLYLPTMVVDIVESVVSELKENCSEARQTAAEMEIAKGPDLGFLMDFSDDQKFYKDDLIKLGISKTILDVTGWLRLNGFAFEQTGGAQRQNSWYTTKVGIAAYCKKDFEPSAIEPIHTDQQGENYFLKDLLLVKHLGLSSGAYSHWIATKCTHSMMTTFLRYFPDLAKQYASSSIEVDFTSHHFRHTLNTMLDEGGLTDLLQTAWFGRTNPMDTKAYQHTSREKRALLLREDIKAGRAGGRLAEEIKFVPIHLKDAVLAARVNAVHDVGPGMCVHNFVQTPCERHLQCSADCDDYVWVKGDHGRKEALKRMFAITSIARETAQKKSTEKKSKKSIDWLIHNDKKLKTYLKQMADYGIESFDPHEYLNGLLNEDKISTDV